MKRAEELGITSQALRDRVILPWYYKKYIRHFHNLSFARTKTFVPQPTGKGVRYAEQPNPIDISAILDYNLHIARMDDPEDFLQIIQTLDVIFLTPKESKEGTDGS